MVTRSRTRRGNSTWRRWQWSWNIIVRMTIIILCIYYIILLWNKSALLQKLRYRSFNILPLPLAVCLHCCKVSLGTENWWARVLVRTEFRCCVSALIQSNMIFPLDAALIGAKCYFWVTNSCNWKPGCCVQRNFRILFFRSNVLEAEIVWNILGNPLFLGMNLSSSINLIARLTSIYVHFGVLPRYGLFYRLAWLQWHVV